jgi:hypothetical protein
MNKKLSKNILFTAASFLAVVPFFANAQSPKIQAARDVVELQVQKTTVIEDPASRIASLKAIIRLTQEEAQETVKKLSLLVGSDDLTISSAAEALLLRANALAIYAELLNRQIDQEGVTDEQVAQIASSLKTWRQEVFEGVIKQSMDLSLISQGGEVLLTAMRRLDKVGLDVSILQRNLGEPAKVLLPRMDLATKLLARAQSSYQKARTSFSEAQDEFVAANSGSEFLKTKTFERSNNGDFITCLPKRIEKDSKKQCQAAFRTSEDNYYLLMNANGSAPLYSLFGVYRVTGQAVLLSPAFETDRVIGAIFVSEINRSGSGVEDESLQSGTSSLSGANVLSTMLETARPSVQALIKAEIADIKAAYNEFVAMINLTKQLLGKK